MKTIATIFPEDVKPLRFQVRCLVPTCAFAERPIQLELLDSAEMFAKDHARNSQHAVTIEESEA